MSEALYQHVQDEITKKMEKRRRKRAAAMNGMVNNTAAMLESLT